MLVPRRNKEKTLAGCPFRYGIAFYYLDGTLAFACDVLPKGTLVTITPLQFFQYGVIEMKPPLNLPITFGLVASLLIVLTTRTEAVDQPATGKTTVTEEWNDPGFAPYVDLELLRQAMSELDPQQLVDAGLQFAEGERVLLRNHKAISSERLLRLAVKLAVEKNDKTSLKRLARIAESSKDAEFRAQVFAAQKLAAKSRGVTELPLPKSLDEKSAVYVAIVKGLDSSIQQAHALGAKDLLEPLKKEVENNSVLDDEDKAYLKKRINAGGQPSGQSDAAAKALFKLAGGSRAINPVTWMTPMEQQILQMVNAERQNARVPALQPDPVLTYLARAHSGNQAAQQTLAHALNGVNYDQRMSAVGLKLFAAGENVAFNQNAQKAMYDQQYGWMNSDVHRQNILSRDYTHIGMGVARGNWQGFPGWFFTQKFLKGGGAPVASDQSGSIYTVAPTQTAFLLKDNRGQFTAQPYQPGQVGQPQGPGPNNPNIPNNPPPAQNGGETYQYQFVNANRENVTLNFTFFPNGQLTYQESIKSQFGGRGAGETTQVTVNANKQVVAKLKVGGQPTTLTFRVGNNALELYAGGQQGWVPLRLIR